MAVHDVGALATGRHLDVDAEHLQGGVRAGQSPGDRVGPHAGLLARGTEAANPHVGQPAKLPRKVLDMDSGAAVHLGRILTAQQIDTHTSELRVPDPHCLPVSLVFVSHFAG
ncbi:hypothetical protein Misp03_08660 [Microbispora sp. NBRC 16548]|nr:hypothetical protein Misp03_08660 [Microbispora sp. NBRC 16548]